MSEEQVGEEVVEATSERDYTSEAENMGWHDPEGEGFRGNKETALSAKDFVEKGENELPVLRANMKKLQDKISKQDADKEIFKDFMNKSFDREKAEYQKELREAVSDGDTKRYDELQKNAPVEQKVEETSAVEKLFTERNDWYGTDDKKTKVAIAADNSLSALRDVLPADEYVDRLEAEIERLMPTKNPVNAVNGSRRKINGSKAQNYEAMPSDIKATCKRMEKDWGIKRDDYVKNYYDGEE